MIQKIKFNKKFKPIKIDSEDEIFPNGIFLFNITKLLNFIKCHPTHFTIEPISILEHQKLISENLDEATIENANLSEPILLAEISPGKFNVIDGNHRVEKARRLGIATLPGIRIPPETHMQFLTTQNGYDSYVRYWNEKARQFNK